MNCEFDTYIIMQYILTAKAWNESSECGSVVTCESTTVSAVRNLVLDCSSGICLMKVYTEPNLTNVECEVYL